MSLAYSGQAHQFSFVIIVGTLFEVCLSHLSLSLRICQLLRWILSIFRTISKIPSHDLSYLHHDEGNESLETKGKSLASFLRRRKETSCNETQQQLGPNHHLLFQWKAKLVSAHHIKRMEEKSWIFSMASVSVDPRVPATVLITTRNHLELILSSDYVQGSGLRSPSIRRILPL
jgi:hypothetical protein